MLYLGGLVVCFQSFSYNVPRNLVLFYNLRDWKGNMSGKKTRGLRVGFGRRRGGECEIRE